MRPPICGAGYPIPRPSCTTSWWSTSAAAPRTSACSSCARPGREPAPTIKRLAVSDHILLGGDNIDLALAHLLEPRLSHGAGAGDARLSAAQWDHLVARCRDLKEKALAADGAPDEVFHVAIPGRGSSLVAGALSAQVTRAEIEAVLLDGFFPECEARARPRRALGGLKEWGLPYAADSAVTRHLAAFLAGRPPVDAVLFNGGSLYPPSLRRRLRQQIGKWQGGAEPLVLENAQPDLAVARGAARFGKLLHLKAERIEAGAARAIFLEAHRSPSAAAPETKPVRRSARWSASCRAAPRRRRPSRSPTSRSNCASTVPVRFQTWSSTRHAGSKAGDVLDWQAGAFQPLPPLETVAQGRRRRLHRLDRPNGSGEAVGQG